jgi:hypothetical protein
MQKPEEKNETSMFLSLESILAPSTCIRTNIEADIEQLAASVKADAILDHLIVRASKVLAKYYPVNFVDEELLSGLETPNLRSIRFWRIL